MKVYDFIEAYVAHLSLSDEQRMNAAPPDAGTASYGSASAAGPRQRPVHSVHGAMHYPAYSRIRRGWMAAVAGLLCLGGWMAHASLRTGKAMYAPNYAASASDPSNLSKESLGNLELTTSANSSFLQGKVYNGNLKAIDKIVCFHVLLRDAGGKTIADRHIHQQVFWPACYVSSFEIQTGLPLETPNKASLTIESAEQ